MKPEQEPDKVVAGFVAIIGIALLAVVIFVPSRKGASPGGKFSLASIAFMAISWGIRQLGYFRRK